MCFDLLKSTFGHISLKPVFGPLRIQYSQRLLWGFHTITTKCKKLQLFLCPSPAGNQQFCPEKVTDNSSCFPKPRAMNAGRFSSTSTNADNGNAKTCLSYRTKRHRWVKTGLLWVFSTSSQTSPGTDLLDRSCNVARFGNFSHHVST